MSSKLRALEKNILKYRAIEMVLLLYYVEDIKSFALGSVRATDDLRSALSGSIERLPIGTKKVFQKLWKILVDEGFLSEEESQDIQNIIDIRNLIGHSLPTLVADISAPESLHHRMTKYEYDYGAVARMASYRKELFHRVSEKYVIVLDFGSTAFEQAEEVYTEELVRLENRINKQYQKRVQSRPNNANSADAKSRAAD